MNHAIETPSGKDAAYENFPVGSWLLPRALRPHVAVFYAFARAADDIADNPTLSAEEKIARLDLFEQVLLGQNDYDAGLEKAARMAESLDETGIETRHCLDLLAAFRMDAEKRRYEDWEELRGYCLLSAAPVGRYLLDLHGGSRAGSEASDALCVALQLINHLQDCKEDYIQLDRVYLPQDWMIDAKTSVGELGADRSSTALRRVIDRVLDHTDDLLAEARSLPSGLVSRRLAMEAGAILGIGHCLVEKLRDHDPLQKRVELGRPEFLWCSTKGALAALF